MGQHIDNRRWDRQIGEAADRKDRWTNNTIGKYTIH